MVKAPPWLVARMEELRRRPPPTAEEVAVQMASSARLSKLLDRGMTQEEIKEFMLDHGDEILAQLNTPWRKRVGENRYEGACGCIFNAEGQRIEWCGEQ